MATELSVAQMRKMVRDHFEEFVNNRNAAAIHRDRQRTFTTTTGTEGDEEMMLSMYKFMPDLHLTIEDMTAEGDKVMCRNIWRWTDTATGKKMQFHGFVLWRFEGTKIAERWATVTQPAEGSSWSKSEPG